MSEEAPTPPPPISAEFLEADDFSSSYANNVQFEISVWDLKMIFGQLDQSTTPNVVEQHTAITVPWIQAKLMVYFLQVNLAIHEASNGKLRVPPQVIPPPPDPNAPEVPQDPLSKSVVDQLLLIHRQMFGELVPPGNGG